LALELLNNSTSETEDLFLGVKNFRDGENEMQVIDRDQVQELVQSGARLIEVLPEKEYETAHIQGAINIPLASLDSHAVKQLSKSEPVIVYCNDYQ
jgi:rhodanese-related sulfurtransferase